MKQLLQERSNLPRKTHILKKSCEVLLLILLSILFRNSQQRCSVRKGVLRNLAKFTEKHLYQSLFYEKVAGLPEACNFIKIETLAQVFPCEFCEVSKNTYFTEHLWETVSICSISGPIIWRILLLLFRSSCSHD